MSTIPKHRPVLSQSLALATVDAAILGDKEANGERILRDCTVYLLAIRMADPAVVYGQYDDTLAAVFRSGREPVVVNGNVDPSRVGPSPLNPNHDEARIEPGVWPQIRGHHRDLPHCFRQPNHEQATTIGLGLYFHDRRSLGEITVRRMRTKTEGTLDTGYFATNVHPGGVHGTSSAGCITAPPDQYVELRDAIYAEMDMQQQKWLPVVLVDGPL